MKNDQMMNNETLRNLVDDPRETLDAEYKSWMDLKDNSNRSKIARHLCALANHGGGYLVFGFNDDMTPDESNEIPEQQYDHDRFSSIVRRYLEPTFEVDVRNIESSDGNTHVIVSVPPHGEVPICAASTGPGGGRRSGEIKQGTYYTRTPGPETKPVTSASEWQPIINRCVINKRESLLADFAAILQPRSSTTDEKEELEHWHDSAQREFLEMVNDDPASEKIKNSYFQLSYRVLTREKDDFAFENLVRELKPMIHDVRKFVSPSWFMFCPSPHPGLEPRSVTYGKSGEKECLQSKLIGSERPKQRVPEFWRLAPDGLASIIRPYILEDLRKASEEKKSDPYPPPGTWLWQQGTAHILAEFVQHARVFARNLKTAESVLFRTEWKGLKGRRLDISPREPSDLLKPAAESDRRVKETEVSIGELANDWQSVVAELLSSVVRVFDASRSVSAEQIQEWANAKFNFSNWPLG